MDRISEAFVHRAIRQYFAAHGWMLVAGQRPGGSDDDLHVLYIMDPAVAKDGSPDPRRHSSDKFVPDLVCIKGNELAIIEAKPTYSQTDVAKLARLTTERVLHLNQALRTFGRERGFDALLNSERLHVRPGLAFGAASSHPQLPPEWIILLVHSDGDVKSVGGAL